MRAGFDDGKDDGALRTIGEVSKALGIKAHVLRYWEQQFPMLDPLKRSGGRRYYRTEDVRLVERIDALVNGQGYTLKGARQVIEEASATPAPPAATQPVADAPEPVPIRSPLAVEAPPATDGGLASFFGGDVPVPAARLSQDQVVARLKEIHRALDEAIRA